MNEDGEADGMRDWCLVLDGAEHTHCENEQAPAQPKLDAIGFGDGYASTGKNDGWTESECHGKRVDTGANGRGAFHCLIVSCEVVCIEMNVR